MKKLVTLFLLMLLIIGSSCNDTVVTGVGLPAGCAVSSDQSQLFFGRWSNHPIPLAVELNDFNSEELTMIENAITTWNTFTEQDRKITLYSNHGSPFQVVNTGGSRVNKTNVCNHTISSESGFSDAIRIYKNQTNWSYGNSVIALTSYCPTIGSDPYFKEIKAAVMEINYRDYFSPGTPNPDLQTVVLHELGHIMGLGHSCSGNDCLNAPDEYFKAVMYPVFMNSGSTGVAKRTLQSNDKIRESCLY